MKQIINRLRRIEGQLKSIEQAIEGDASCDEIVPQLLAVKGALSSTIETYLQQALDGCESSTDTEKMQRLIRTLLKHST